MDNNLPIEAIPGKQFHYSSNGYSILGYLAEVVSGKTYGDVVREKILNPLRMDDSETVLVNQMRTRLAKSYLPLHGDRPEHPSDPLVERDSTSTPRERAAYLAPCRTWRPTSACCLIGGKVC